MSATLAVGAMNLGDGLKLETQILDGKTKLILAPYGAQAKGIRQVGNKVRPQNVGLKIKQSGQILRPVESNTIKSEQPTAKPRSAKELGNVPSEKPTSNVLKELENKHHAPVSQQKVQPAKQDSGKAKPLAKKTTVSYVVKQKPTRKHNLSAEELRESLVCLTQEQFQQILMTINQGNKHSLQDQKGEKDQDDHTEESVEENITGLLKTVNETTVRDEKSSPSENQDLLIIEQSNMQNARPQTNLFSTFGEREIDKSLQEAKKAQWRKELDEQVALKKKLNESSQDWTKSKFHEQHETEFNGTKRVHVTDQLTERTSNDTNTPVQEDGLLKSSLGTETDNCSPSVSCAPSGRATSFSSPELPAAIRSAFVLGEVAPLDHPFSAVKRHQQKMWLEELNKQRDEVILRKKQEKQKFLEAEEPDRWAMHFDSFKKQNTQPPIHNQIQQYENQLPSPDLAHSEEPSVSPATSYLHRSGSGMQKSLDEDNVQGQKTGFLRTMTSLLDPVQIEERDKKRLKRMEHEKALAAQVEERRKKKQQEEERRLREEQEEEQKLSKEREQIRKQFEEDAFRQKQKEEIISLKTKELYQSMQRAQEEAQRIKQEQRMRHLAQKGHDVSKLQRNLNGEVEQLDPRSSSRFTDVTPVDLRSGTTSAMKQTHTTLVSPRKDTAVQTDDVNSLMNAGDGKNKHREERLWRDLQNYSPDIPIEFKDKGNSDVHMRTLAIKEKSKSSKENKNTLTNENDHLARTENQVKESVKRPDWNKNKPNKRFLPASERYPKGLQKQREESKIRRQKELLHLVERNNVNNLQQRKRTSPERTTSPDNIMVAVMNEESQGKQTTRKEEQLQKVDSNFKRPVSPPVPAVKNRLHQMEKRPSGISSHFVYNGNAVQGHTYTSKQIEVFPESSEQASERPPSSHFIPYVRTKEIYYLDPDAPMSRPSTHDPQYRYEGDHNGTRQIFSSDHAKDPLLNPNVLKNKDRQQAILKGLSELRKGLLQKQKELETGLIPDI